MDGWIKLYRSLCNHWLWEQKPYAEIQAWIDLLFMASFSEVKSIRGNNLETKKIGEIFTSEKKLMERWGWGKEKLRKFLNKLKKDEMISIPKADRYGTVINIVNYGVYQENFTEVRPKTDQKQTESRPQYKNYKKYKNINPLLSPLKKGGKKKRNDFGSYDLELFEKQLNEQE